MKESLKPIPTEVGGAKLKALNCYHGDVSIVLPEEIREYFEMLLGEAKNLMGGYECRITLQPNDQVEGVLMIGGSRYSIGRQ